MGRRVYEQKKIELLAHQAVTHPDYIIGPEFSIQGAHELFFWFYHASVEAAANTNPGVFHIQGSPSETGRDWFDLTTSAMPTGTPADQALAASEPAGETVIAVTGVGSTTGFVARDSIYIQNPTVALGEWHTVKSIVTDTSITLIEGLDGAQDANSTLWGNATRIAGTPSLTSRGGVQRIRLVFDHLGAAAANSHIKATGILVPSLMG